VFERSKGFHDMDLLRTAAFHVIYVLLSFGSAGLFLDVVGAEDKVAIGHFPNITHAQPMVGRSLRTFEKVIGVPIDWKAFNAGPSEMEALIAGHLDIAYVGPNPAVNAFLRSKGKALKIIAGAASGGASLVVSKRSTISSASEFKGKRIASPELGNTQDVALRHWLKSNGMTPGRDVQVLSIRNPDILLLFQQGKLDGAWVPEPWVTRLIKEGGAKILFDERSLWPGGKFTTGVVVVRIGFYGKHRDLVRRFLEAHVETTKWIVKNSVESQKRINGQLAVMVGKPFPEEVLSEAFSRVTTTYDPLISSLMTSAGWAHELGYLPRNTDLSTGIRGLLDVSQLNEVLKTKSLALVPDK
jgi:NitT/TauT family transport system substrate-binding protein